jgi:hypothetical protein
MKHLLAAVLILAAAPCARATDYSVNAPTVPCSGCVLLQTVPAFARRQSTVIQNQSTADMQVSVSSDDGTTTVLVLYAGSLYSTSEARNVIKIYGLAGSAVAILVQP